MHGETTKNSSSSVYTKPLKRRSCDSMQSCERLHHYYSFVSGHSEQAELTTQHGTHPVENFVAGMLSPSSPEPETIKQT